MSITGKSLGALLLGVSLASFASLASAQPNEGAVPTPSAHAQITEHRAAALKKCTSGVKFASDAYVTCMENEGENP
jgi:hypothetical protein